MGDDAKTVGGDSAKAIQEALESVTRLEAEGQQPADFDGMSIEVLRPTHQPPSGDPSGEGFVPPDPELEREYEGMSENSLEGAAIEGAEVLLEDEPPKKGKTLEAAMLEAMITAKNEAIQVLAQTQIEAKSLQDRLLRLSADYENFKKRQAREKDEAVKFANERLLKELLPVVDNMERAMEMAEKSVDESTSDAVRSVVEGVQMVMKQLGDAFGRFGVEPFSALGTPFDPARHEAVAQRDDESVPAGTVIEEYQRGYLLHNRLARPAMVVVSAGGPAAAANNDDERDQGDTGDLQ
jgi:molecular chaperone GrpE